MGYDAEFIYSIFFILNLNNGKEMFNVFFYILSENSALDRFCVDLTARASEGLIDPIFGRDSEVERVVEILCRRTKNNPILIGESGVGKTAIAEGLALSIAQADAPFVLLV